MARTARGTATAVVATAAVTAALFRVTIDFAPLSASRFLGPLIGWRSTYFKIFHLRKPLSGVVFFKVGPLSGYERYRQGSPNGRTGYARGLLK